MSKPVHMLDLGSLVHELLLAEDTWENCEAEDCRRRGVGNTDIFLYDRGYDEYGTIMRPEDIGTFTNNPSEINREFSRFGRSIRNIQNNVVKRIINENIIYSLKSNILFIIYIISFTFIVSILYISSIGDNVYVLFVLLAVLLLISISPIIKY